MSADHRNPKLVSVSSSRRAGEGYPDSSSEQARDVTLAEANSVWWKIGLLSFGGPAAQIALMHRILVEERGWLSEKRFLNALSFCMLLPGPEAMQLATWAGWRMHGVRGGLIAGLAFVLPGAAVVLMLAAIYAAFGSTPLVQAVFLGIKAAVIVIVVEALLRISKRALQGTDHWMLAGLAFIGIFFFAMPFPLLVLLAGLYGFVLSKGGAGSKAVSSIFWRQLLRTVLLWLVIWIAPLLLLALALGQEHVLVEIGALFSKLAVVTFGGAYAVLAYLGQEVAVNRDWLSANEMIDGLGLAETTPGPLILVTEFVAYLAGFKSGGFLLGVAAVIVGLWATFAPCFLFVFAGAPFIERLDHAPKIRGALAAITAAVVGVILNLAVWFGLHALFTNVSLVQTGPLHIWMPDPATLDWRVLALTLLSGVLLLKFHWSVVRVLGLMAVLGLAASWL